MFLGVGAVEAGERLYRLNAGESLVDLHRVQEGLVVAGLEFVGADEESVRVFLNLGRDFVAREASGWRDSCCMEEDSNSAVYVRILSSVFRVGH